jgi:hypothetical protein
MDFRRDGRTSRMYIRRSEVRPSRRHFTTMVESVALYLWNKIPGLHCVKSIVCTGVHLSH